jgi:hypothetical protein
MARINTYSKDTTVQKDDKLLGSNANGTTRNFSVEDISTFQASTNAGGVIGQLPYVYHNNSFGGNSNRQIGSITTNTNNSSTAFSAVTTVKVSKFPNGYENDAVSVLNAFVNKEIIIASQDTPNNFGIYTCTAVTQDSSETNFYDIALTYNSGSGSLEINEFYSAARYIGSDFNTKYDLNVPSGTTSIRLTGSDSTTDNVAITGSGGVTVSRTNDNSLNISSTSGTVTSVSGTGTVSGLTLSGTVTSSGSLTLGGSLSLTSSQITTGLGFTPYNATNPSGYTSFAEPGIFSGGGSPSLASGVTAAEVRTLIGAGTSSLALGTSSSTALAGDTTTISSSQASAISANTSKVSDTGVPAILSDGSSPTLNTGITAAEVRTLIGAGTSSTTGTVTSVGITPGTGISVSGSPVTSSGNITVTNSAPDTGTPAILSNGSTPSLNSGITAAEVRSLIGAGTSSTTGTVTSVGGTGTVSGLTLSGTVTSSGNLTLGGSLSLTSGQITTGLGFTPYNATNPDGFTSFAEPGIFSGGGTPTLASGVTGAEIRSLIGAGTSSTVGTVTGTGTTNYLSKFTGSSAIGNSLVFDNGTNVGIGTASPSQKLHVDGHALISAEKYYYVAGTGAGVGSDASGNLILRQNSANLMTTSGSNATFAGAVTVESGLLHLGKADTASGHINSKELMTFNIDTDNDDTNRYFGFYVNGESGSGTELLKILETGAATFAGNVQSEGIKLDVNTSMYTQDASLSYYSASNGVYLNGAGNAGWLRLNASGANNDSVSINLFGTSAGNFQTFKTNSAERMRIDGSGNVGIGTTSPDAKLEISDATDNNLRIGTRGGNMNLFSVTDAGAGSPLAFEGSQFHFITGNVGIGTTSPSVPLHVVGNSYVQNGTFYTDAITAFGGTSISINAGSSHLAATVNSAERMRITSAGRVGIGTTSPAEKLTVSGDANITGKLAIGIASSHPSFAFYNQLTAYFNGAVTIDDTLTQSGGGTSSFSGNVGIGTTSPSAKLHVRSAFAGSFTYETTADDLIVESNANGGMTIATAAANTGRIIFASPDDATGGEISFNASGALMKIGTTTASAQLVLQSGNGSEALRANSSGNIGIGTTSPAEKLEVNGIVKSSGLHVTAAPRIDATAAPGLSAAGQSSSPTQAQVKSGGNPDYYLSEPDEWLAINISGTTYVIPAYET